MPGSSARRTTTRRSHRFRTTSRRGSKAPGSSATAASSRWRPRTSTGRSAPPRGSPPRRSWSSDAEGSTTGRFGTSSSTTGARAFRSATCRPREEPVPEPPPDDPPDGAGGLRAPLPDARLPRPVRRARPVRRGPPDGMDAFAGRLPAPGRHRGDPRARSRIGRRRARARAPGATDTTARTTRRSKPPSSPVRFRAARCSSSGRARTSTPGSPTAPRCGWSFRPTSTTRETSATGPTRR